MDQRAKNTLSGISFSQIQNILNQVIRELQAQFFHWVAVSIFVTLAVINSLLLLAVFDFCQT